MDSARRITHLTFQIQSNEAQRGLMVLRGTPPHLTRGLGRRPEGRQEQDLFAAMRRRRLPSTLL